jgi:hypothetical protein
MGIKDIFLTPIYLILLYMIAFGWRSRIKDRVLRSYFLPAFQVKIIGAIALGFIYQFYYGGGDTFNFFIDCAPIWDAFWESPTLAFKILFLNIGDQSPDVYKYTSRIYFFSAGDVRTFQIIRIAGFFSLFTFYTYLPIALFFAFLSFTGMWAMYRVFYDMYPQLHRPLAYAVFFIPSVYFWGSGLLKDTICIGAMGWILYGFYFGLILRRQILLNLGIFSVAIVIVQSIKIYIIASFLPAILIWLFLQYRANIRNAALRLLALPITILISIPFAYFALIQLTADNAQYNLENIANTSKVTADWLKQVSDREGGSGYSLGEQDGTIGGLLRIAPRAIWLGLFEPHPWQARNPVMLLSALETSILLLLTLKVLWQIGLFRIYGIFLSHPITLFCLIFCIVFAFGVATSSYNYGSLVRYRIPLLPFYLAMLYIIRFQATKKIKLF